MRSDMAKVIVERPRKKGGAWEKPKGYQRRLRQYGDDGAPQREGMKRRWEGGRKYLNEHLGPLRRYLNSQVGRPWNKVFAEICAHINRSLAVQDHVRDHVDDYVAVHVLWIDGVPCNGEGGGAYGRPLHQTPYRPWYVCPKSGLLKKVKPPKESRKRPTPAQPSPRIRVSDTLQCRLIDDAWHLVTVKPLPAACSHRERCQARDILLDRPVAQITDLDAKKHYGALVYAVAKRRLARREQRQYPIPVQLDVTTCGRSV